MKTGHCHICNHKASLDSVGYIITSIPDEAGSILKNIVILELQRNGADSTHSLVVNGKNGVLTISEHTLPMILQKTVMC